MRWERGYVRTLKCGDAEAPHYEDHAAQDLTSRPIRS